MNIRERIAEYNEEALLLDGHDNAFIGLASRCGGPVVALYDPDIIVDTLHAQGMTTEEAQEYYEFNPRLMVYGMREKSGQLIVKSIA